VQDGVLAGDGDRGGAAAVEQHGDRVERGAQYLRLGEVGDRQGRLPCPVRDPVGVAPGGCGPGGVVRVPVQDGPQKPGVGLFLASGRMRAGVIVARASARLDRECAASSGHLAVAYEAACWYQVTVTGCGRFQAAGSPVAGSNARPVRAARTSSAR
jgi:hypothetical protein